MDCIHLTSKVVVFDAGGPNYNLMADVVSAMANRPEIKQFSSSSGGEGVPSMTLDNLFREMALQGQTFFQVSGDGDFNNAEYGEPYGYGAFADPYVTTVGATTLTMNGAGGSYASETVWNWGLIPGGEEESAQLTQFQVGSKAWTCLQTQVR